MKNITFTLDGNVVEVPAGTTILSAAEARGTFIPTFCHNKELKPFSSCFVCVVEIEGRANLVPSCSTAAADGMVVRTASERVLTARRTCLELLLSDHEGDCLGPCMTACPAGIDIPGFVAHLARAESRQALELIHANMPLPGILGRVCTRPCETACRRQLVEEPIAICHLKRYAADSVHGSGAVAPQKRAPAATGKRVAIVGAGPAGLSAAYYLQLLGHACTVFDRHEKAGGMVRYGIPSYRLPREVIEREAAAVENLGAVFRFGATLGRDVTLEGLKSEYDAVFLGMGAQKATAMGVPGEDLPGVVSGIGFLGAVSRDEKHPIGKTVMVVGGGNTAIDAARTALRLGAKEVSILYRRTRAEMPAWEMEIRAAEEEGVKLEILAAPTKIERATDGLLHVTCIRMALGEKDASGRQRPVPQAGSEHVRVVENVIAAIGQGVDAQGADGLSLTKWGSIAADPRTQATSLDGVFAGGDCVSGADIAVTAVAAGRRAAIAIDQRLTGRPVVGDPKMYEHSMGDLEKVDRHVVDGFEKATKLPMPELHAGSRAATFAEVETGFGAEAVRAEAARCMACGCRAAHECRLRSYATAFDAEQRKYTGRKHVFLRDASHTDVLYESHKCIQCGTCVRLTEEILGTSAMGFVGRGITARVQPALGRELARVDCRGIEKLVEACPVGALTFKNARVAALDPEFKRPPTRTI
jgi:NADPH-dependent glutamate synthase beta subunit-like oxidoreductase